MKRILLAFMFLSLFSVADSYGQQPEEGRIMFTLGGDPYKTDNDPFDAFNKFQAGLEGNFFIADKFSIGLGLEYYGYSGGGSLKYLTFSPRFYPVGGFFLRVKPLIPLNKQRFDIGTGLGIDIPLGDTWAFEVAADYYIDQSSAAMRLGLAAFF